MRHAEGTEIEQLTQNPIHKKGAVSNDPLGSFQAIRFELKTDY